MVTIRPLSRSLCRPLSRALVWLNDQARAYLLVDPAGDDNAVLYTAKAAGAAGELVSVAYATPAEQATTTVAVVANAITVTPGTKARMVVTGTLTGNDSQPVIFPVLLYIGIYSGAAKYTSGTYNVTDYYDIAWSGVTWHMRKYLANGILVFDKRVTSSNEYPDGLNYSVGPGTGTPTVTAGVSSAAQVIAAVNTPASASAALVTASASGASTGAVAAVTAAFLTLIPANALTLDGKVLTLDGQILTLD